MTTLDVTSPDRDSVHDWLDSQIIAGQMTPGQARDIAPDYNRHICILRPPTRDQDAEQTREQEPRA